MGSQAVAIDRYRDVIVGGPIVRTLLRLGLPLTVVELIHISYNVADAFWLSRYSSVAMVVPRQVWPLFMFFNAFLIALSTANMALLSQYVGARRYGDASDVASKFFTTAVLFGIASCITYMSVRYYVFRYVVMPPSEVFSDVMDYSGIIAYDLMLSSLVITYSTILQSIGDTRIPAVVGGVSAVTNIVLDPFLILGIPPFPRLGVVGAAIATVFSRFVAVVMLAWLVRRRFPDLRVRFVGSISGEWVLKNLAIGGPMLVFSMSNSLAFMFQIALVNSFGIITAAAFAIGFIVMEIADAAIWGMSMPTAIMVGQNLGAGNLSRCRLIAYKASLTLGVLTGAASVAVYLFRVPLINSFTSDVLVFYEAIRFLDLFIFSLPFFALFFIGMSVGRGSGHTLVPMLLGVVRLWLFRICLGYLLAYYVGLGSYGIWIALSLSNVVSGVASFMWVRYGGWVRSVIK